MDREAWLEFGQQMGWIGPPICYVHDAPELTDEENEVVDGDDGDMDGICIFIVRLMP